MREYDIVRAPAPLDWEKMCIRDRGLIPEDRKLQGLVQIMSVERNTTLVNLKRVSQKDVYKRQEPFTGIGRALKEAPGWALVLPMCITNGYEGYFPTREAYDEGGYEARSSVYAAGVAETISAEGLMSVSYTHLPTGRSARGRRA